MKQYHSFSNFSKGYYLMNILSNISKLSKQKTLYDIDDQLKTKIEKFLVIMNLDYYNDYYNTKAMISIIIRILNKRLSEELPNDIKDKYLSLRKLIALHQRVMCTLELERINKYTELYGQNSIRELSNDIENYLELLQNI